VNASTKTAPSGSTVPAEIRSAAEPGKLARESIQKAIDCANALHQLDAENEALRAELRAAKSEIEALKKHIEQMAVLA
jgi:predicted RNase H-like nuclease (RuvC/YqgF family)